MTHVLQNPLPVGSIEADLILVHSPSVYDFRERDDIVFAYLSDSDSVNVTSIYEMYPLGFLSIKQYLMDRGYRVEIINLASLMLIYPQMNVERLLARLKAPVFGLDLHWMAHCQGSIEVAKAIKAIHPDTLTLFGGISATYYASELIRYPSVDMVMRGYDTLEPLSRLMASVVNGVGDLSRVPNLLYKDGAGEIVQTDFSHKPQKNYNDVPIDWSFYRSDKPHPTASRLVMTLPNTGCAYDCSWCGGSRYAFRSIMDVERSLIQKDHRRVIQELQSLGDSAGSTTIYALQCYSEPKERMYQYLDNIKDVGVKSVSFEQYDLPDRVLMKKMAQSTQAHIMLSPESHDLTISRLAGRGNYSMKEMEDWIPKAFDAGIKSIVVWFFIGMPQQTSDSVLETVSYSIELIKKFRGMNVIPVICPMAPFLDPGSRLFVDPQTHGYRLFYKTLEEHRQAMIQPLWYRRLNYETRWMSRHQIQDVTYEGVARLVEAKGELGVLPSKICKQILGMIKETITLLSEVERGLEIEGVIPVSLREEVIGYNRKVLSFSSDQIVPIRRQIGGRWFDDFTVPGSLIEDSIGPFEG